MEPRQSKPVPSSRLSDLVQQAVESILAGHALDLDELADGNSDLRDELQSMLPAIEVMAKLDGSDMVQVASDSHRSTHHGAESLSGVLGDFRIIRVVGRGGMGTVYEAEQLSLERPVALKVLPFASMLDERQLRRFKQEARAAALLQHPNIVRVFAVGCDRGIHHYAMELIEGESLAEAIKRIKQEQHKPNGDVSNGATSGSERVGNGSLADTQAVAGLSTGLTANRKAFYHAVAKLGIDVARALSYAHCEGVVHRDIKPSNLLLDHQGKIWITDFGLALMQTGDDITQTGDVVGTLRYMSPEQLSGDRTLTNGLISIHWD